MLSRKEYLSYDGLALADLVRTGQLTKLELFNTVIREIESLNLNLNAVVHKQYDRAREFLKQDLGEGVFSGLPCQFPCLITQEDCQSVRSFQLSLEKRACC